MKRLLVIVTAGLVSSCGVVGAPVAPETIGVAPTVERQKRQHALSPDTSARAPAVAPTVERQKRQLEAVEAQRQDKAPTDESEEADPPLEGQDEDLPPLRPVGTR